MKLRCYKIYDFKTLKCLPRGDDSLRFTKWTCRGCLNSTCFQFQLEFSSVSFCYVCSYCWSESPFKTLFAQRTVADELRISILLLLFSFMLWMATLRKRDFKDLSSSSESLRASHLIWTPHSDARTSSYVSPFSRGGKLLAAMMKITKFNLI